MDYVIIGNSAAAIGAVEGIRKNDLEGKITIISDEPYNTYSRPLISYYLAGKVSKEKMSYRKPDFYEQNKVEAKLGVKVIAIDHGNKKVVTKEGEEISYDKLLVATGGKPFVPPIKGLDKNNVFSFIKLEDVIEVEKVARENSKAIIVGAGLIGLKAAEALVHKGVKVKVVELSNRILSAILDEEAAALVQQEFEARGVEFSLNTTIDSIDGEGKADKVTLKNGEIKECDFLIIAIGVTPNVDIVKDSGVRINRGIVVSDKMETNLQNIYAAGDVSEGKDIISGEARVLPILPNAYKQGEVAGANMAGQKLSFEGGFAMNSIGFFGLPMITAGIVKSEGDKYQVLKLVKPEEKIYKKIVLLNNKVVGYICLKNIDRAGIYTSLIKEQLDIEAFKETLLRDDFGYVYFPEELRKDRMIRGGRV